MILVSLAMGESKEATPPVAQAVLVEQAGHATVVLEPVSKRD